MTRQMKKGRREQRLAEPQPAERQAAERQAAERQLAERQLAERRLAVRRLAVQQPAERQLAERQLAERRPAEARIAFRRSPTSQRAMGDSTLPSEKSLRLVPETLSLFFGLAIPILARKGASTPCWFGGTGQPIRSIFGQATSLVPQALVS